MTKTIRCGAVHSSSPARLRRRFNLRFFNLGLLGAIIILGCSYLISISDLTVKGFALQELKAQVSYLSSENLSQKEEVDNLQSYYALNSQASQLNMVAVDDIEYLNVTDSVVAKK